MTGLLNRRYLDETLPRELARANKLRAEVAAHPVRYGDLDIAFTVSAGVAVFRAKNDGRNRVSACAAPADANPPELAQPVRAAHLIEDDPSHDD